MSLEPESAQQPGRLAILSDEECWDLLRTQQVGRIAWSGIQGVTVVPVNFIAPEQTILLRTTAYSLLARDSADREVAFEVDCLDPDRQEGWSVLVRGRCRREDRITERPEPWVTGPRHLGLSIDVRSISGRRITRHAPAARRSETTDDAAGDGSATDGAGHSEVVCFTA